MQSWLASVPEPDARLEPDGFMVEAALGDRVHFLDWGAARSAGGHRLTVIALHGLGQTAWIWAPVGRRLGGGRAGVGFLAPDLRGHGLSDAPTEDGAYDLHVLAEDVSAVADGAGAVVDGGRLVLVGHGFGAIVAALAARAIGNDEDALLFYAGSYRRLETTSDWRDHIL